MVVATAVVVENLCLVRFVSDPQRWLVEFDLLTKNGVLNKQQSRVQQTARSIELLRNRALMNESELSEKNQHYCRTIQSTRVCK